MHKQNVTNWGQGQQPCGKRYMLVLGIEMKKIHYYVNLGHLLLSRYNMQRYKFSNTNQKL